jgi:hypothetical protein
MSETPSWRSAIRRAFDVPDVVHPEKISEIVGRKLGAAQLGPESLQGFAPPERDEQLLRVRASGIAYVEALIEAAEEAELDLALCGIGEIKAGPDGSYISADPDQDALEAITRLVRANGKPPNDQIGRELWEKVSGYIRTNPHDQD